MLAANRELILLYWGIGRLHCDNTPLNGNGNHCPDLRFQFLKSEDSYILLTMTRQPPKMTVEIKGLDGSVLDRRAFSGATK